MAKCFSVINFKLRKSGHIHQKSSWFSGKCWRGHASSPTEDSTQDQYGYDGVDFDWEYPGADDRGGTTNDGVDFTSMLEELRTAIDASSRDYIVTFTAPTSYWYLRHFDITAMTKHVDWINLMAYDLHGVWDRDVFNPVAAYFTFLTCV